MKKITKILRTLKARSIKKKLHEENKKNIEVFEKGWKKFKETLSK